MKSKLLNLDEYRNNPEFYFYKGLRLANKKNISAAYKNLVKASILEPGNSEYKFNMACFLSELQQPREANRIFNDILLNYAPTLYDCYFGLGCNYLELGDIEKAAENFDKYLYFDDDGEFSQEVQEMLFYLKLYNNISHDNKFIELSKSNLKRAKKSLKEAKTDIAINQLYRSIAYNPLNIEARNLITLALMENGQYRRAEYINITVRDCYAGDIWANCLCIYILSNAGKQSRVNKFIEILVMSDIDDRDDLFSIATTLMVFNKIGQLVRFLQKNIVKHCDSLIYSILLLGYILLKDKDKAEEVNRILCSSAKDINDLSNWIEYVKKSEICAVDEYERLLEIYKEPNNYMYNPVTYRRLLRNKKNNRAKVNKKYLPIVECALKHREIMYAPNYEKEIIEVLNNLHVNFGDEILASSAAVEYIYCKKNNIEMNKDELIKKYDITHLLFEETLKKIN